MVCIILFYGRGNWGSGILSHFPSASLLTGRAVVWIQVCLVFPLALKHPGSHLDWKAVWSWQRRGVPKATMFITGCTSDSTCRTRKKDKILKQKKMLWKGKNLHNTVKKPRESLFSQSLRIYNREESHLQFPDSRGLFFFCCSFYRWRLWFYSTFNCLEPLIMVRWIHLCEITSINFFPFSEVNICKRRSSFLPPFIYHSLEPSISRWSVFFRLHVISRGMWQVEGRQAATALFFESVSDASLSWF